jgi:hypothetical protein
MGSSFSGSSPVQTLCPTVRSAQETQTESSNLRVFQTVAAPLAPPAWKGRPDQGRAAALARVSLLDIQSFVLHPPIRAPLSAVDAELDPLIDQPVTRWEPRRREQQRGIADRALLASRPVHHRTAPQGLGQRDRARPCIADVVAGMSW